METNEYMTLEFTKEKKRTAIKAFSRVQGAAVAYLLIGLVLVYIAQFVTMAMVGPDGLMALAENPYYIWGLQVLSMYLIAFPLFLLMVRSLPSAKREKGDMSLREFGVIFLISEAIMLAGSMFSGWLTSIVEGFLGHEIPDTTSELIEKTPLWIIILVVVIIGPVVEELIFRKVFIDKLSIYGDRLAVVVSAFAFGIFHGNLYQLFYATALGLVLGYVYTKTRKSIYNCLLHVAINFMGTVPAVLCQGSLERLEALPEDALLEGNLAFDYLLVSGVSLLQYGMAIAGVILLIKAIRRRDIYFSNECDIKIPAINLPRVVVLNAGGIFFLVFCLAQCISSLILV